MPDNKTNLETLDLRFRAPPKRASGKLLPGGVAIWVLVGALIGITGWIYGRKELMGRLAKQVSSGNSASASLFALEALESLEPQTLDHLVVGLHHSDPRVAKSAYQKVNLHIDHWETVDITLRYAAMKSLAIQLQGVPRGLPEANLMLVRSLAARLYSSAVSIDDPHVKPVTEICQRLLVKDGNSQSDLASTNGPQQVPPAPLVPLTQVSDPVDSQPIHRSSSSPVASLRLVASPTRPRTNETSAIEPKSLPAAPSMERRSNEFSLSDESDDSSAQIPEPTNSVPTNSRRLSDEPTENKPELPVLVATPASIASHPVAKLRVVSNQPDLAGIEKLQIAELVRLLAHENPDVAKAATLGLRHHGLSDSKINLASELAMGTANRRLELIQQLATAGESDPRPWLVWMAEDGEPEVRRMAISFLIPMADEYVYRSLRNLAARENDNHNKELITRALLSAQR